MMSEAENNARDRLMSRLHGDQELRVGWKDEPLELMIEGTPHALRLVQHLISEALTLTKEGNTVTAIHQKTGAKIIVKRADL